MTATRIVRPESAFSTSPVIGARRPRQRSEKHLAWIRTLPCVITLSRPVEAAHIRYADSRYGKRETGKSEKPSDIYVIPLHPSRHREQHEMSERRFWAKYGIDPVRVAVALWINSGDDELAYLIIRDARRP